VKYLVRDQDTSKSDRSNKQNAIISLFKWRAEVFGDGEWEPDDDWREHSGGNSDQKDQPHFTDDERARLRDAVLDFRSVPHYNTLEPDERDDMKTYLAQRLGKEKDEITPDDFGSVPTRKYASLIQTTLDAGLRPSEVAEFRVGWFDPANERIIIPEEHSKKNTNRWVCSLQQPTALVLSQWVDERETRAKYDGSERMWLTKYGNPYGSGSLNRLLDDLCEHAGIEKRDRTWYSIRRSTANVVGTNASAEHARQHMRHKQVETTMRYIQPDEETTREALNQGG
jgi:integrase